MKTNVILLLALMFGAPISAPLQAQQSSTRGIALALSLGGASLNAEDQDENDRGGGLGLELSYGLRHIQFFLGGMGANMQPELEGQPDYSLGFGDLGVRYVFSGDEARWRPFAEAAFSRIEADTQMPDFDQSGTMDVRMSGPALTLGGGVSYFTTRAFALGAALRLSGGKFDEAKLENVTIDLEGDDRIDVRTARFELRGTYYFKH